MQKVFAKHWPVAATFFGTIAIVIVTLLPYDGNITAMFHLDDTLAEPHPVPENFVVLDVPGYDGAQYYQIARNIPQLVNPARWHEISEMNPLSYAYQRILLPVIVYVLSLGQEAAFPYVFLILNIISLALACAVVLKETGGKWLYALAFVFCPSAMVALHFTLAEPLALLLFALFLTRYIRLQRIGWIEVLMLSMLVLSREVNILFAGLVLMYSLYRMRWKDAALAMIPIAIFLGWHATLFGIFGDIPFLTSAGARQFPGSAALKVTLGMRGYDKYTLSAAALFIGFVLPAFVWSGWKILKGDRSFPVLGMFAFLCLMLTLADYIWGSITSVGRVITPVYPLSLLAFAAVDTKFTRALAAAILLIGLAAGIGLALIPHPFTLA
jgi:hypothetical protein